MVVGPALSSCQAFPSYPLITDRFGPGASKDELITVSATAERRFIFLKRDPTDDKLVICSEPSPDVAEATSRLVEAALKASVTSLGDVKGGAAELGYTNAVATTVLALTQRSQGLQMYRDAMFFNCQSLANGCQSVESYRENERKIWDDARRLVELQINSLLAFLSTPSPNIGGEKQSQSSTPPTMNNTKSNN